MNASDDPGSGHRQTWELIPWMVNGRASEDDRRMAEQHLAGCADCREEFEFQRRLHATVAQEGEAPVDPRASFQNLMARIEHEMQEFEPGEPSQADGQRSRVLLRGLVAATVIQAIALSALGTAYWMRADSAAPVYRTLTAPETGASRASIRMVPAPAMTLAELQQLLAQSRLQIVSGPSEAGVYSLAPVPGGDAGASPLALQRLRADPGVRFAEPVNSFAEAP